MNSLDIILSIGLLYGLIKGFSNGIIREITIIISVFISFYAAINLSQLLIPYLQIGMLVDYEKITPIIGFLIIFLTAFIIIKSIGDLIEGISNLLALGLINKFLGSIFGLLKILVVFSLLLVFESKHDFIDNKNEKQSILIIPLKNIAKIIIPKINQHKGFVIKTTKTSAEKAKKKIEKTINPE